MEILATIEEQVKDINGNGNLRSDVGDVLNMIIYVIGLAAVIVIIIGGINIVTSQGDPSKVKKGKDAVLYGVIGLIVTISAWAIVRFVLNRL